MKEGLNGWPLVLERDCTGEEGSYGPPSVIARPSEQSSFHENKADQRLLNS